MNILKQTLNAAFSGVNSLCKHITQRAGNNLAGQSGARYVELGLESLQRHKVMNLDTPPGEITRNYEERCDFHGTFPLSVMFEVALNGRYPFEADRAIASLRYFNQAGQLINDLKDFIGGDLYRRDFSDIRRGVPTVPLVYMYQGLPEKQAKELKGFFGKGYVNQEEQIRLASMVADSHVVQRTVRRIKDCYEQSLELLSQVVDDTNMNWFKKWTDYKVNALKLEV